MKTLSLLVLFLLILQIVPTITGCGGLPTATFTTSVSSGPAPLNVTFSNTTQKVGADSKIVFDWDFGDGAKQSAARITDTISHEYTKTGTYTVTLKEYTSESPDKTIIVTQTITVTHGVLSKVSIKPETVELKIGQVQVFSNQAFDSFENPIPEAVFFWKEGDAGTITTDGSFTAGKTAGVFLKGVLGIGDLSGTKVENYPKITILPDLLASAALDTLEINAGESKQLVAVAKDQYGNKIADLKANWTILDVKAGTVTSEGLFTASKKAVNYENAIRVTFKQGDKIAEATGKIVIKAGAIAQVGIAPDDIDLGKGMTQQYFAVAADKYGNRISGATFIWSCIDSAGKITSDGMFTAGNNPDIYNDGISATATSGGVSIIKKVRVTIEKDLILFASTRDDQKDTIIKHYVMNTDGSNVKEVKLSAAGEIWSRLSVSSDGRRIIYTDEVTASPNNVMNFRISNTEGKWSTTVLSKKSIYEPSFSPDGQKLVYISWEDTDYEIISMNIDGSNKVTLTNNSVLDDYPVWSPDSTKIAFVTTDKGTNFGMPMIFTMNADGSKQKRLTQGNMYMTLPKWSPDGKEILFQGGNILTGDFGVYIMNADGTDVRPVSTPAGFDSLSPYWSPDGKTIVFDSNMNDNEFDIYTINRDRSNLTRLTDHENLDFAPVWLPLKKGVQVDGSCVIIKEDFSEPNMTAQEISNQYKGAVVRIEVKTKDGSGSGSGFIIKPDGVIVTANHVISGAETITVYLPDKTQYTGTLLATDKIHDLALVKIKATNLPFITIGSLSGVNAGQQVVVLGYPLGNESVSVTSGLVSAIEYDDGLNTTWVQTDSAINPGNSGGPLIDMHGKVIGIVTQKMFGIGIEGIGFAVSADTLNLYLKPMLQQASITIL